MDAAHFLSAKGSGQSSEMLASLDTVTKQTQAVWKQVEELKKAVMVLRHHCGMTEWTKKPRKVPARLSDPLFGTWWSELKQYWGDSLVRCGFPPIPKETPGLLTAAYWSWRRFKETGGSLSAVLLAMKDWKTKPAITYLLIKDKQTGLYRWETWSKKAGDDGDLLKRAAERASQAVPPLRHE